MDVLRKFYRSSRDKKLFGLCGGLAEMLNVDATLLRILLIVVTIFTSGAVILIYIIAGLVVPKEPPVYSNFGPNGYGNGYGGSYNPGYGQQPNTPFGGPYKNPPQAPGAWNTQGPAPQPSPSSQFDSMMDDLEKKALRREIEELKAKIAKYEKGDF
ncbi:PspC domain-containing protein [Paenibacillus endophyticus]|uniref:PspC domain-containing protein n=1 Tax=Paenibacillus endophyticus TaxID=1294268 RepID=UPI00160B62B3|nr:PspC domain-containing protein [Paenibacillus endophyticus]